MAAAPEPFVPDSMMRFSPTPYTWKLSRGFWTTKIESNDLDLALGLRWNWEDRFAQAISHVRLVVDHKFGYGGIGPHHEDGPLQMETGPVRTLLYGTGNVLFYDAGRRELLGFLSPEMSLKQLLEELIPALIPA